MQDRDSSENTSGHAVEAGNHDVIRGVVMSGIKG
jgi:hypothetical protein